MNIVDEMARRAGFRKAGEVTTENVKNPDAVLGMRVIASPLLPDGFFALANEHGAAVVGPKGVFYVPFGPDPRWPHAQPSDGN